MRREKDELWSGNTYLGRWKVISRPGAVIQARILEMSDEMRRRLTAEGVEYLPPPNLDRFRAFWHLPGET